MAESCFGFDGGAEIDLSELFSEDDELDEWGALFGESLGRIVVSVDPNLADEFQKKMGGHPIFKLGKTTSDGQITAYLNSRKILECEVSTLKSSWKGTLDGGM